MLSSTTVRCLLTAAGTLLIGGCVTNAPPTIGPVIARPSIADGQVAFSATDEENYVLRSADSVSVTVFREPDLSVASVLIDSDGTIALPLIGPVRASGRTPRELAGVIGAALGDGYVNRPRVSVNVLKYDSHRVTVEGAVRKPGVFQFAPGSRLSAAIALAEGPERVAKLDQVVVFRDTPEGVTLAKFDYRAMQQGTMIDPILKPGDRVVVGTSGLSQSLQDLLQALPAFALFTRF